MAGQYLDRADTEMTQYGLSARAPFFNNGSAQTLLDAVHFYENRFGLVLTAQEESDLVAFLSVL
jgi:cytochrome c peroxidase